MFRRFEELVDPFQDHDEPQPSFNAWRYLLVNLRPFRSVRGGSVGWRVCGP